MVDEGGGPGPQGRFEVGLSLVVLTRTSWLFRTSTLAQLHALGFRELLCLEEGAPRYDAAYLSRLLPGLRFLIFIPGQTVGAKLNAAAREVRSDKFLVLWDDQSLAAAALNPWNQKLWTQGQDLAVAPSLQDARGRVLPSVLVPGLEGDSLKILALGAEQENVDTLFPFDYTAVYDRERFLRTGGFEPRLANPFWQKADWGLRSRLWGERLVVERAFQVSYTTERPSEDQTPDRAYGLFFLRNLAVRHSGDHGVLPWSRLPRHLRRSGGPWHEALGEFLRQRAWVARHRYRFTTDVRVVAELWGQR